MDGGIVCFKPKIYDKPSLISIADMYPYNTHTILVDEDLIDVVMDYFKEKNIGWVSKEALVPRGSGRFRTFIEFTYYGQNNDHEELHNILNNYIKNK